jgi:hypothetical protein
VGDDGVEQDLFDRPFDRTQGEALLEQAVGLLLVEGGEGGGEARARRWALAALASAMALETLWVSDRVARSDSISARAYWRCPPGDRRGRGNP